jgi:hypothetical protein
LLTEWSSIWYIIKNGKRVKIIPENKYLVPYFTGVMLAHFIIGDGYWDSQKKAIYLCTENFSKTEVIQLITLFQEILDIKATPNKRVLQSGESRYRIRFSRKANNLTKIRSLVIPHMHPLILYKLGN